MGSRDFLRMEQEFKPIYTRLSLNLFFLFTTGTIDIWWIVHDGGLLLLLGHLLSKHKYWERCKLRVNTVVEKVSQKMPIGTI